MTALVKISYLLCVAAFFNSVRGKVVSLAHPESNDLAPVVNRQLIQLAEATSTASPQATCPQFNVVVDQIGEIITNTVTILTGTINAAYSAFFDREPCTLSSFRCFLKKFHTTYSSYHDVITKIQNYSSVVSSLNVSVKQYFNNKCWNRKP